MVADTGTIVPAMIVSAIDQETAVNMNEERFQKTVLPNGIRVISEYIDSVYSVALGIWAIAGSQDETRETNGIAHLLEHMAFKGTKTRSAFQIANEIESLGGSINAFTGKNVTCYYVRLMSEHLSTGIDVLSDLVLNPQFDEAELKREKGVIIEEIREIEDTPSDIIHDYFTEQLFPDHPIGWSIQGAVENIQSFTTAQLTDFIEDNYTSDRLLVVATGRVHHDELVRLTEKYFSVLKRGSNSRQLPQITEIVDRKKTYQKPISQSHIVIGRRVFPQSDPRRYPLALLNVILSGGMSSRLFHNIRERYGFVYSIYSFSDLFLNDGLFGIYAGVDSRKLDVIRTMIYDELKKIVEDPVSDEELKKVKQQFEGGLVISLEGTQSRNNRLAKMEIYENRIMTIKELLNIIDRISVKDITDLAKYLVEGDQFIETIIIPEKKKHKPVRKR
ncbi:MAG: insulinase family protein [Candidatus Marinimicrobia bacterium]|nr:insulinase family protein [Candidatus Neomarinimicrobiota bacterium]